MQQPQTEAPIPQDSAIVAAASLGDAPPKQVALAMERLSRAARLIADIRLGADHLVEALFMAADALPHQTSSSTKKTVDLLLKEEAAMRQHFLNLRTLGRQLEESGVLNASVKSRGNSWSLQMPLVCPDGAVVAYAWKRQLAGQAGASAVDRTRLALKAFSDQKRRFFPHLEDDSCGQPSDRVFGVAKKLRISRVSPMEKSDELRERKALSAVLVDLEHETSGVRISTFQRSDWLKRASSLQSQGADNSAVLSKDQSVNNINKPRPSSLNVAAMDHVAVIEVLVPSVFRAVISLHPAGSTNPGAVAFFSPDEGGSYVHSRGCSGYHVFRQITEYADKALQYFISLDSDTSLSLLLLWICNYQTLFTKVCSKCGRLLMMEKSLSLLLPPVYRPYRQICTTKFSSIRLTHSTKGQTEGYSSYHIGCYSDDGK